MRVPWMRSVTLPSANTPFNLFTLIQAVEPKLPRHCQALQIQLDAGAGGAHLFIGNPDSPNLATDNGADLVASQAFSIPSLGSNLIVLDGIAVQSGSSGIRINLTIIGR